MREIVRVAGGLANKMFHCAFAMQLETLGYDVMIDVDPMSYEFEHDVLDLWKIFPCLGLKKNTVDKYSYAKDSSFVGKIMRRLPYITGQRYYISHSVYYDSDFSKKLSKDGYIIGYFQNEKYFSESFDKVKESFQFAPLKGEKNVNIAERMKGTNSVAIHVRKGDGYATWPEFQGTCPQSYYKNAIDIISEKVSNVVYYVFTDSPEWVIENFKWFDYTLINWNPCEGWGNHFDMQLMSLCKHNIIANSTYSWWGAWLNSNPDKVIIAPKVWFNLNSKMKHQPDIIPSSWLKI